MTIVVYSLLIMVIIAATLAAVVYFGINVCLATMGDGQTLKERLILLFWGLPLLIQALCEMDPED